ncbi:MAG: hypothetical protein IKD06_06905 [Clostridia bacterium]|nr:hypothetical protein [Clostridia bacterium]
MKKLLVMICALAMVFSLASLAAFETVDVVKAAATIDGVIADGEWAGATAWEHTMADMPATRATNGLGIQGSGNDTCPDMKVRVSFMIDADYLYILETRSGDTTPVFNQTNPGLEAENGDGSYLFFMKNGTYNNAIGIVPQLKGKTVPGVGTGAPMNSDNAEVACTMTADGWVLEAKVKLSALGYTYDDFANGIINLSYCAANMIASTGTASANAGNGGWCQMDFEGVTVWAKGPKVVLVDAPAPAPETVPAETAPATAPATTPAETAPATTPAATTPTTGGISLIAVAGLGLVAASLASKKRK